MTTYAELDAQLAALQAELKEEIQSSTKKGDEINWPEAPDFDSLVITKIEDSSPTVEDLEQVSAESSVSSSSSSSKKSESSAKAEEEVDQITNALMSSLENGTAPEPTATEPRPMEICYKCKQPIASFDAACSAMGNYYHITCLTCLKCGKALHGSEFIVMGTDDPYCQDCYEETLEVCVVCKQTIRSRILRAAGEIFHPECFNCSNCGKNLDGVPFTQDESKKPFCIACYQDLYSPKCEKCKKAIAPEPGQQEALRIIALEKSFHKACFTCKACEMSLSDKNSGGCYPVDSDLFCKRCSVDAINNRVNRVN